MEVTKGFLRLQDDHSQTSRRSSVFPPTTPVIKSGLPYATKISCGCGQCFPVKVEREEGTLRIGRCTLAANCHVFLLIFGVCFLLVGGILTALAYNVNKDVDTEPLRALHMQGDDSDAKSEKVAGPLFLVVGSCLLFLAISLTLLGCKLTREARGQLHSIDSPNWSHSPAHFDDTFFNYPTRRSTLSTITQAVPVGFFMAESPRVTISPTRDNGPGVFQEVQLSSPPLGRKIAKCGTEDDEFTLPALSLRPSLPLPMFPVLNSGAIGGGMCVQSRSDQPFGSIASLGGGKQDIACFPNTASTTGRNLTQNPPTNNSAQQMPPINVHEMGNQLTSSIA